jgi:hypothetical protein
LGRSPDEWRTYFWLQTFDLLRDEFTEEQRERYQSGLLRALEKVVEHAAAGAAAPDFAAHGAVSNHFCWYALTTYRGGQVFDRADWRELAADTFARICAAQQPGGYWREGGGLTTLYNYVSLAAVSLYHEFSRDPVALETVRRGLELHKHLTYPNGAPVETVDGRVRYHGRVLAILPPSWSRYPQGRATLRFLVENLLRQPFGEGHQGYAFFTEVYRYVTEGLPDEPLMLREWYRFPDGPAAVRRLGPWMVCLSGLTRPAQPDNRWLLDRQNHLSLWHNATGLIVGGGGSKGQPDWSTFVVTLTEDQDDCGERVGDCGGQSLPPKSEIRNRCISPTPGPWWPTTQIRFVCWSIRWRTISA